MGAEGEELGAIARLGLLPPEGYTAAPLRFVRTTRCLKPSACGFVLASAVRGTRSMRGVSERRWAREGGRVGGGAFD
jgi:hypothetical protein